MRLILASVTKDSLSIVDEQLNVDDVCAMFGQHVISSSCHRPWPWFVKTLNQPQLLQHFPMRLR